MTYLLYLSYHIILHYGTTGFIMRTHTHTHTILGSPPVAKESEAERSLLALKGEDQVTVTIIIFASIAINIDLILSPLAGSNKLLVAEEATQMVHLHPARGRQNDGLKESPS